MAFSITTVCILSTLLSSAFAVTYNTRYDNVTWDDSTWTLRTTNFNPGLYQSRQSLSNGYIGISLAAAGPFFEIDHQPDPLNNLNGWPLFDRRQAFAGLAGFYDRQARTNGTNYPWLLQYGDESVASGLPHWSGLSIEANDVMLDANTDPSTISNFSSSMDHKRALLTWDYIWTPAARKPLVPTITQIPDGQPQAPYGSSNQGCSLHIIYTAFVNKLYVNRAAVQAQVTALGRGCGNLTFHDVLAGNASVRTNFVGKGSDGNASIWSAVSPDGVSNVTAFVYSTLRISGVSNIGNRRILSADPNNSVNQSSISQTISGSIAQGQTIIVEKYIGAASSDAFPNPQQIAKENSQSGAGAGWADQIQQHTSEWLQILTPDSVDSYKNPTSGLIPNNSNLVDLEITAVTNPFHMLQNTVGTNAIIMADNNTMLDVDSIAVCGLASSCYAGMIFWDVEVWMAPGLQVSHPAATKQISNYRVAKSSMARANINTAYQSSQNATGEFAAGGVVFPWTSGRYGNCTGTGPCFDYEYHINGDIGLEMYNYLAVSGDWQYFRDELSPIYDGVAQLYSQVLTFNETVGKWTLLNATDPDEYANNKNDPGYTLVLIKTHLEQANEFRAQFGRPINETWASQAANILIPVDTGADIIIEYQSMNGTVSVKQADVILIDDLLDYPNNYSLSDLDYYAGKQSLDGPGMTYSSFGIVANEISPSGCSSYTYHLQGQEPYIRPPWYQFSEQLLDDYAQNGGTHPAFPFLTGMGGANRVAVFGYLGLRLMIESLNVDPSLPPEIPYLKYRTIYWQGHAIAAHSNQTHTVLTRTGGELTTANQNYSTRAIPVTIGLTDTTYSLYPNGSLTLPNRQIGRVKTVSGNIAQCQPAMSSEDTVPGQFALAAVDGAISTKWQPLYANQTAHLIVTLPDPPVPIIGFSFDWAANPPMTYSISFSNDSSAFSSTGNSTERSSEVISVQSNVAVQISTPYNATTIYQITPYMTNSTNVTLSAPVWSGKYARLTILGNLESRQAAQSGTGATVAEWAIIGMDGTRVGF